MCIPYNGYGKRSDLWYSDYWKMLLPVKYSLWPTSTSSKTLPSFLPSHSKQREITHSPGPHFSENAISPSRKGEGEGGYVGQTLYLHCQSLIICCFFVKYLSIWTFTKLSDKYITKKIYSKIQSTWENNIKCDITFI